MLRKVWYCFIHDATFWAPLTTCSRIKGRSHIDTTGRSHIDTTGSYLSVCLEISGFVTEVKTALKQQPEIAQVQLQSSRNTTSSINTILANLSLVLPDQSVSVDTFLGSLDVEITDLSCDDLSAKNVTAGHKVVNSTVQTLTLDASGLGATCTFDWTYAVSFFSGSGAGTGYLDPASFIKVAYDFVSEDYAQYPPTSVIMSSCATDLKIEDLELVGDGLGVISSIVELFKSSISDLVEGELDGAVCADVLGSEVLNKLNEVILSVNGRLEPYLDQQSNAQDPLYLENTIEVPTNSDGNEIYVNFQQMKWFDQIQTYVVDNVNSLINDTFLNNNGVLEVDTSLLDNARMEVDQSFMNGTNVTITSLTILGLDSLYGVELLEPIGKFTLQNSFKWKELTFILEMEATHDPSEISDVIVQKPDSPPITESFTMEMTFKEIAVDLSVLLGINMETLGELALGSILYIDNILPCIRSAVEHSAVTQLLVEVSQVSPPNITGFLDDQMNTAINMATDAFFYMYQSVLLQAVPSFFGTVVKDMINNKISEAEASSCPEPKVSSDRVVDYRDLLLSESQAMEMGGTGGSPYGDLLRAVYGALVDIMSASNENGLSEMNQVVSSMTKNQSGVEGELYWDGNLFKRSMTVNLNGLNAAIAIAVSDLKVSNLDTMGSPIEILAPVYGAGSNLNNSASIGVGQDSLRASLKLLIFGEGERTTVDNEIEIGISLSGLKMILEFIARMEEPPFINFPMLDIFNLNCWMATIETPELDQYGLRLGEVTMGVIDMSMIVEEAKFDMNCISCSSPVLLEMEDYFNSEEGIADSTTTVNTILDSLSRFMEGEYVQNRIDKVLYQAPYQCPHSPEYDQNFQGIEYEDLVPPEKDEDATGFLIAIIVVVICVVVLSTLAVIAARFITRRRHNRWLKQLNETQIQTLVKEEQYEAERQKDLNMRMSSLVRSPEVPLVFKIGIPITIFGNIALFLSGHLSLGGTVNISGSFAGQDFNIEGFFEFSMVKSTIDMWLAGAKELAILIAIFSGLWPYTKQLISLFLWLVKPSLVSSKRRGVVLHWLDLLGKWSMVDVFVLLTTLASFRITIESPSHVKYLPEGLYEVNMLVVPLWGLYANS
ncbi:hypothetical protein HJC23_006498 [Cyclotella cryptica]|uniref:Lipid-binding serum glycoprotein C-terminal domain-containing protein n=1 Tax=Cyclotella cryptica TaxID=29204 RepID=A0ABD3PP27_9STRA